MSSNVLSRPEVMVPVVRLIVNSGANKSINTVVSAFATIEAFLWSSCLISFSIVVPCPIEVAAQKTNSRVIADLQISELL